MTWTKYRSLFFIGFCSVVLAACSISYKFSGSSINYDKVKTIAITDFPITSAYVYAPLGTRFNDELKDIFIRQTRLDLLNTGPADLEISGQITGYNQYNQAVKSDGYSSETKLTVTVSVNFTNNTNHEEDFEGQQFSAFRTYDSSQMLTQVQDQLIGEMVKDIVEQIFNATAANW